MKWTRMLGGAVALSAALLLPAAAAAAQVPGQCATSATDCMTSGPAGPPAGDVNVDQPVETSAAGTSEEQAPPGAEGEVLGITAERGAPAVAAAQGSGGGAVGGLAFTGSDVLQLTALGVGSIAVGTVLMRRGRRSCAVAA